MEPKESSFSKYICSFVSNIKSNNYSLGTDFDDLGEIVHLTPKKEEALNIPEIFSLNQFLQFLKDAAGIQNNHIVQVVINFPS